MAKELPFRFVKPESVTMSGNADPVSLPSIDWGKCVICQSDKTKEKLTCPANNPRQSDSGKGYETIANSLQGFCDLGEIGAGPLLTLVFTNTDVETTLSQNAAKWHKSCSLRYNNTELKRAQKR